MVLDYKDYDKLISYNKKRTRLHTVIFVLFCAITISTILFVVSWRNNTHLQELLASLKFDETARFIDSHYFFFHQQNAGEARALLKLVKEPDSPADEYFSENLPGSLPSYWNKYVEYFLQIGNYHASKAYVDYLSANFSNDELNDYKCISATILNNFTSSDNCLSGIKTATVKKYASILIDAERSKKYNWIFDRNGIPLIYKNLINNQVEYYYDEIKWLKPEMLLLKEKDHYNRIFLTLDMVTQKAAYKALGKYEGSLILMGKNGNLIALVSKENDKGTPMFFRLLKPGSIIKIVTSSAAFRNKVDLSKVFPIECKGFIVLFDKLIFYDWIEHKTVNSIVEALSVSCNISFGIIGHALKINALKKELENFGINRKIKLEAVEFDAGKIIDNSADPAYEYSLAIGDKYVMVTPLLSILWASSLINDGIAMSPFMMQEIKSITGNSYKTSKEEIFQKFTHKDYLPQIKEGMVNAVETESGTGKKVRLSHCRIALKTGTAGEKTPDYDSVIIGYAPVENSQVAFSLFALHAGRASQEGTRIIKEFLSDALPQQLK